MNPALEVGIAVLSAISAASGALVMFIVSDLKTRIERLEIHFIKEGFSHVR